MVRRSRHFDPIDVQQLLVALEVARSGLMVMRRKTPIKGENDCSDQRAMESVLLYVGRGGWTAKSHPLEAFSCQTAFVFHSASAGAAWVRAARRAARSQGLLSQGTFWSSGGAAERR